MKDRSPSGHANRPQAAIHQKGMHNKAPSAVEPKPKGGSVRDNPTRSAVGQVAPRSAPRVA